MPSELITSFDEAARGEVQSRNRLLVIAEKNLPVDKLQPSLETKKRWAEIEELGWNNFSQPGVEKGFWIGSMIIPN
jgi:hypothetical protein